MTRFRTLSLLALALGLFLTANGTSAQFPRPKNPPPTPKIVVAEPIPVMPPGGAMAELPLVPRSSAAFLSVKTSDLLEHPDLKAALDRLRKSPDALDGVGELIGVSPLEIDRVTLFWPTLTARGPLDPVLVITTQMPYNEARVLKALKADPVFADGGFMQRDGGGQGYRMQKGTVGSTKASAPAIASPEHLLENKSSNPPRYESPKQIPVSPSESNPATPPNKQPPLPRKPIEKPNDPEDSCTATATDSGPADPLFYAIRRGSFGLLFMVNERTLVFLPGGSAQELSMMALIGQLMQKKTTGPLSEAIAAGGTHTFSAGTHLPPLFREFDQHGMPPELAPYAALTAARTAVVTGDLGKTAKLTLNLTFDEVAAARRAAPVLEEGLRTLAEKVLEQPREFKDAGRSHQKALIPLLEAFATGLKKATVKFDGTTITATTELDVGPAAGKAVKELLQSLTSRKKFAARTNNLKQIGLALHNYESTNNRLPSNTYGPKGEPLLSWRVQLLPYLEQQNLYQRFKLDEPWDSPNNKSLIDSMPTTFDVVDRVAPQGQTFYQAFLTPDPQRFPQKLRGRSWLVEGGKFPVTLAQIPDGTSNTIAVVEARTSVVWSKPDDLPFADKLPPLGAVSADRFMVLMLDGSVRSLSTQVKPEVLRLLIDTQDGQVIPDVFDDEHYGSSRSLPGGSGGGNSEARAAGDRPQTSAANAPGRSTINEPGEQLARAQEQLRETQALAEALALQAKQALERFQKGVGAKADVENTRAALEEALRVVEKRKDKVQTFMEELKAANRGIEREESRTKGANPDPRPAPKSAIKKPGQPLEPIPPPRVEPTEKKE